MRVDIIGGGPAGLFLSILLRRDGIADDVRLFERYPATATYGWGVVFPEGALTELARADPPSHAAITRAGTTWTPVEIRYQGTRRRVNGNSFHGVPRTALLAILRDTASTLGVQLNYQHPVTDLADHAAADLVVGADGVNSVVRRSYPEGFGPQVEHSAFRYAWFGVDRVFTDFTYIFRDTEWGLFQGYCYPSGRSWSSMIIYLSEQTWERSGLAGADEQQSVRLCEQVFAADLAGGAILANGSPWANFAHLTCRSWQHGNAVLVGDAAHTAHWSIGSGTRLAIEDAIALAGELAGLAGPGDLPAALTRYELARREKVERFQAAARRSERYFENLHRYFHFEPIQFAYQLMVRSWRITHDDIARRDPAFAASFDAWFHSRATGRVTHLAPSPAFAPLRVGGLELRNRVVTEDGTPGSGLAIRRAGCPGADGRLELPPADLPAAGPDESVAAIRVPPLSTLDGYPRLAGQALAAGYAMVVLDLAGQPLSALADGAPQQALAALRAAWPVGRPVGVALAVGGPGPTEPAAAAALARSLAAAGADLVLLEAPDDRAATGLPGQPPGPAGTDGPAASPASADGSGAAAGGTLVVQVADAVRNDAGLPVVLAGAAETLNDIDTVIAAGWADFCVLRPVTSELVGEASWS
jgi:anthraniloyl-CoA monooxygenase